MTVEMSLTEARRHLSRLLNRAEAGDEVVITRRGHPPMALVPHTRERGPLPDITREVDDMDIGGESVLESLLKERAESRY